MRGDDLTALADSLLKTRKQRKDHFPSAIFTGEAAWNMLLALFVSDGRGTSVSGYTLIDEAGCSIDTGRRWIKYFSLEKYVVGDGDGQLDDILTLTPKALHGLEQWLEQAGGALAV